MTTVSASISVENLSVRYNNGHIALQDVSFHLENGTICALIGVNGGGKSTLFKSLMGLVKPLTGSVKLSQLRLLKPSNKIWFPMCHKVKKWTGNFQFRFTMW
ncbi:Uncharacterized ABC transporter ATP-binding protein HI_1470 [Mannheimia haemolytica]|uniref:Uncharacterized ABC transporter ATP-binding protein HI_1470 n=1 Tax=Mannheimia haemolytica TaxID=75985 RepID=A0A378MYE7_MANHA|nr:Uncharacterized ABC transporter ATP-binding protein HI_1470 [Mannheimia haemolytica]